jgi:hypothetical protein
MTTRHRRKPTPAAELQKAELYGAAHKALAKAVRQEGRICFGLAWFDNEADAIAAGQAVHAAGYTVNGGYFHGMPCDRASQFDYEQDGVKLYAVRT